MYKTITANEDNVKHKKLLEKEPLQQQNERIQVAGKVREDIRISGDKGYILWIKPEGSFDIIFKYGQTGYDFWLHVDPQFCGVQIFEVSDSSARAKCIYNGKDDLTPADGVQLGNAKYTQDNTFQFRSISGKVRLRLDALPDREKYSKGFNAFRLNYTMAL